MSNAAQRDSPAARATDERFMKVAMGEDERYPNGSAFVASDVEGLERIIERNLREGRPTVIVHEDGSDIVIEPPSRARLTHMLLGLAMAAVARRRAACEVTANGRTIDLPPATRVRLHPPEKIAA